MLAFIDFSIKIHNVIVELVDLVSLYVAISQFGDISSNYLFWHDAIP